MNTPIPTRALPVAQIIRDNVPRPAELPRPSIRAGNWLRYHLSGDRYCPLGLLPGATHLIPHDVRQLPRQFLERLSVEEFGAFVGWWDSQDDAISAVTRLWGS